jgi:hypothetical protein
MLFGGALLREAPGQHEFGLEYRPGALYKAIQGGGHPADYRVLDPPLDILDDLAGVSLVPAPVEVLRDRPELDGQVVRKILWVGLPAFLAPQTQQAGFVAAHDDAGIRAADEPTAIPTFQLAQHSRLPLYVLGYLCSLHM